jgi:hypothetical protein
MSQEVLSGTLVGDAARDERDTTIAGSEPELQKSSSSEEALLHRHVHEKSAGEPPGDPLWVVALRGVAMLVAILMPLFAIVLQLDRTMMVTYESRSRWAVGAGLWAIFAVWIILDKGMASMLEPMQRNPATAWLLLGLGNLGVALWALSFLDSVSR